MENLRVEFICYPFNNIFIYLIICLFSWFFFIGLPNTILFINLSLIVSLIPFFLHHFLNFVHVDKTAPAVTPPIVPVIKAPAEFRLEWWRTRFCKMFVFNIFIVLKYFLKIFCDFIWFYSYLILMNVFYLFLFILSDFPRIYFELFYFISFYHWHRTDTVAGIIKKWYTELNEDIQEYEIQVV